MYLPDSYTIDSESIGRSYGRPMGAQEKVPKNVSFLQYTRILSANKLEVIIYAVSRSMQN